MTFAVGVLIGLWIGALLGVLVACLLGDRDRDLPLPPPTEVTEHHRPGWKHWDQDPSYRNT